ncbi:hypothetical protein [Mycobacterium arosiense]|uniref:hypothetical protein n=1 Tax=Mycobacterium arosiense TaxID=425468 RepID=UPI00114FD472|nr:hypothetical protein [Mycobacterium arosiense]
MAVVIAIGAGSAGVAAGNPNAFQVQPVVVNVGFPMDPPPPPVLPTADQLTSILTRFIDPMAGDETKNGLVEGGFSRFQRPWVAAPDGGHGLYEEMRNVYRTGNLPLSFNVTNIRPAGANAATADVAISQSDPDHTTVTEPLMFVDQGGWRLSYDSAMAMLRAGKGH